ncbi:hypothetical protein KF840_21400 [bacterium]|nr:hypothetical protein [bacterium]
MWTQHAARGLSGAAGARARRLLLVIGMLALGAGPAAARWPYTLDLGPLAANRPEALAFDAAGNAYLAGTFSGTATIGGMQYNAAGQGDIVVVKLDVDGNLLWTRVAGSAGADTVNELAVDASGNAYLVGGICGTLSPAPPTCTATFGGAPTSVSVAGNVESAYVAKLTADGTWEWVRPMSRAAAGTSGLRLTGVAVDGGNVFIGGWVAGGLSATTGGGFSIASRQDRTDAFFAKLSSAGQWSATQTWPSADAAALAGIDFFAKSVVVQGGRVIAAAHTLAFAPSAKAAAIARGPVYTLPGGGSCTVNGSPSRGSGATVSCTGIDVAAHGAIYFGLRNDQTANGNTMTGAAPSGTAVFRLAATGNTANTIAYASATTIADQISGANRAVDNQLTLTRNAGTLRPVEVGSGIANNANGDVTRLFEVGSGSFAVDVAVRARLAGGNFGIANPAVFDAINTLPATRDVASVDVAFYYEDVSPLVVLAAADLAVQSQNGLDLGFAAEQVVGDGASGLAAVGYLPAGKTITYGGSSLTGPGLAVARFDLDGGGASLSRSWVAGLRDEGGALLGRKLAFGLNRKVYTTASYLGLASFVPESLLPLDPFLPTPGSGEDIFVGQIDDDSGNWSWAQRAGGAGADQPTDIASDPSSPSKGAAIVGSYLAPAAFGKFQQSCESTCPVLENNMTVNKPCNRLNEGSVCMATACNLPLLCLGGVTPPSRTGFAMKAGDDGEWLLPVDRWVVGREVPRPANTVAVKPAVEITGLSAAEAQTFFFWAAKDQKLFAAKPSELPAKIKWQKDFNPQLGTIDVNGVVRLPDDPQVHLASAPVDIELSRVNRCAANSARPFATCTRNQDCGAGQTCGPLSAASTWSFGGILYQSQDSDAAVNPATKVFTASGGWATLLFVNGPSSNTDNYSSALVVVRTLDPAKNTSGGPAACTIGAALSDPDHVDPNGKNGWMVNARARYDGVGASAAYTRDASRSGPILPVNRDLADDPADDMLIAWYRQDGRGIAWPSKAVRYDCQWPANPDTIIVASGLGSDGRCRDVRGACQNDGDCASGTCQVQPPLTPAAFPAAQIYSQDDPALAGFNPNEEHALLLPSNAGTGVNAVFALRNDLNATLGLSDPYVLLKYRDPATQAWRMRVYGVALVDPPYTDVYPATAGQHIQPPYPLTVLPPCVESCAPLASDCAATSPACQGGRCVGGSLEGDACTMDAQCQSACLQSGSTDPLCGGAANLALFKDHIGIGDDGTWKGWWARSAGTIRARYDYPVQQGFYTDFDGDGTPDVPVGTCEPWLVDAGTQRRVTYNAVWPANPPVLQIGETLLKPKRGLPAISTQAAASVVFETTSPAPDAANEPAKLVRLIDPLTPRAVTLEALPTDIVSVRRGLQSQITGGENGERKLSPGVSQRLFYDATAKRLSIKGVFDDSGLGEPFLALNVMTARERDELKALSTVPAWKTAVDALYMKSRNPNDVDADGDGMADDALDVGFTMRGNKVVAEQLLGPKALSAGLADGTGYVTVAFNNDPTLSPLPITLSVLRVDCGVYQGQVHIVPAANVFDEAITLRHSGDFGGDPSGLAFEWYYALKEKDCRSIAVPAYPAPVSAPWIPLPGGMGVSDVTLSGPGVTSLADTCVVARYRGYPLCSNATEPSQWAGAPLGPTQATDPRAQLVPGWLTRVTAGLNPFDQRTKDFRNNGVDTLANALVSAGARFEGPIAFNSDADALNSVGLIDIYETVLDRGRGLSIDQGLSVGAVDSKLLDVAARIADLYMLLGNEAFGDALDPTIGFDTSGQFGTAAPSIFAFQDQTDSLLSEELALLRGRDDSGGAPPVYNRLIWNFTGRNGQVAYQQNYKITDQDGDGDIDEFDARKLFPQGHGDAWGHYLTALTGYYKLLRHPNFIWLPRSDSVLVAGSEVLVDFTDERRFAAAAAARARTGAQIVDLTYRQRWVDDPAGQWQGYKDTDASRAFGVSEWAARSGQGAFFDWVVANAILPPQSDAPPGIEKIDRTTVPELAEIASQSLAVQAQLDLVDQGMNPLGLAKNVVPFDVDPAFLQVGSSVQGKQHYEQIADRAGVALANAVRVFDYANGLTQLLRRNQDTAVDFARNVAQQERDYNNRLIELFGSPYKEDIGPGRTYKLGYTGPDVWNWNVVDESELTGEIPDLLTAGSSSYTLSVAVPETDNCEAQEGTCRYDSSSKLRFNSDGTLVTTPSTVTVTLSNSGFGRIKDASWTTRESPGELQLAQSDLLQTRAQFERAVKDYERLIGDIECVFSTIRGQNRLAADRLVILNRTKNTKLSMNALIFAAKGVELGLKRTSETMKSFVEAGAESVPKVTGLAFDALSGVRGALKATVAGTLMGLGIGGDAAELAQLGFEQANEIQAQVDGIALQGLDDDFESFNLLGTLGEKLRQEPSLRLEALTQAEAARQAAARLQGTLARGVRLIDELEAFRKMTASKVAERRYSDMAFRVFRNDALQKYRAQLDLASRYAYLTAAAYDYETNLQGTAPQAGRKFLTDIVRQRSLGQFVDGQPVAGSPGLGDTLAQMKANFSVLKGQLGFNTPQTETNRFSLRKELFRVLDGSDDVWRSTLAQHRVANLWDVEAFRRFARPPGPQGSTPLPGIVIPIPTTVTFGLNFFGWPLSGGDSAYDPTNFATKVRTMGVWFKNYNAQGLSNTPRVYLIPVGADVLRSPAAGDFRTRNWAILDQRIPVPFPIGNTTLSDLTWIPQLDSLSDPIGDIRRHSSFRAYHDSGSLDSGQVTTESRAIARSVWNTRWVLIITGGTLLADADQGLNTFIYGKPVAGGGTVVDPNGVARDGKGISDILIFFQTYALSGN